MQINLTSTKECRLIQPINKRCMLQIPTSITMVVLRNLLEFWNHCSQIMAVCKSPSLLISKAWINLNSRTWQNPLCKRLMKILIRQKTQRQRLSNRINLILLRKQLERAKEYKVKNEILEFLASKEIQIFLNKAPILQVQARFHHVI